MRSRHSVPPLTSPFDQPAFCCKAAERFSQWVDRLVATITTNSTKQPTQEQLGKAKALLVDEFRKERNGTAKAHRDRLIDKAGDPCIYGVFIATLDRLADIPIDPPQIPRQSSPPRPASRKPQQRRSWVEELEEKLSS